MIIDSQRVGGRLADAARFLREGSVADAEQITRSILTEDPCDVGAICLLADVAVRFGRVSDARSLMARAVELAPKNANVLGIAARVANEQLLFGDALAALDEADVIDPESRSNLVLRANIFARIGKQEEARLLYQRLLAIEPSNIGVLLSLGHTQKTLGDAAGAIETYRKVVELKPDHGDAWWSIADMKTKALTQADIERMRVISESPDISRDEFIPLAFALGQALEDQGSYAEAFRFYQRGNAVRRRLTRYSSKQHHADTQALIDFFTKDEINRLAGHGHPDSSPIFIVGLPRSGSTLVEQILSCHSQVDGTQELPDLLNMARRLSGRTAANDESQYPSVLGDMEFGSFSTMGAEYLERTGIYRRDRRRFIDKLPNNFQHVGLIHLILPNATIIDARRNPMDCCFSCYKQHFAKGQNFTYALSDLAEYYNDYIDLMRHWDSVIPGRVIRIVNEDLIANPEGEIRRLLSACGLPFEPACLDFHRNTRSVRTPSAEQVRRPINAKGIGRWEPFAAELEPLRSALGDTVQRWKI